MTPNFHRLDRLTTKFSRHGWPTWNIHRTPTGYEVDAHGGWANHEYVRVVQGHPGSGIVSGTGSTLDAAIHDVNAKLTIVLAHLDTVGGAA